MSASTGLRNLDSYLTMQRSETKRKERESDMSDFGFWVFMLVLVVLFYGEPDLHSSLLHFLNK